MLLHVLLFTLHVEYIFSRYEYCTNRVKNRANGRQYTREFFPLRSAIDRVLKPLKDQDHNLTIPCNYEMCGDSLSYYACIYVPYTN